MKIVGYNVTFSDSFGHVYSRRFSDFKVFVKYAEPYIVSGYTMFVTPIFN